MTVAALRRRVEQIGTWRIVAAVFAAYAVLYWVPGSPFPDKLPWGVITQGVIFGSSYALLAMGLILIYRSTRIVNFAYGAMGAVPGAVTVGLFVGKGVNYFVAIVVGVAVGLAVGAAVDIVVIRRFADSSRLVLTVASIGLAQILAAIGLGIAFVLGTDLFVGDVTTPLSGSFFVRPYPVRGDHILLVSVAPIALALLAWFLLRTRVGIAVRAAAENRDRARLLGIPVRRLQTITWMIAGGLSTISYVTRVPFTGVIPDGLVGITTILPGLAAAVLARFQSLVAAFWAGLALGLIEWTIRWNVEAASIFNVSYLVVILVALLLRRHDVTRAETGGSSWDSAGLLRPLAAATAALPRVKAMKAAGLAALLVVLVVAPHLATNSTVVLMAFALVWAIVALSLVVLTGWGGNVSLGQFAIVGAGAMAAGNVFERANGDFFLATAAAIATGGLLAVAIGVPALRIRGLYLAVTTLAFAVALDSYFLNPVNFRGSVPERVVRPVLIKRFDASEPRVVYYASLAALVLTVAILLAFRHRRAGRSVVATRDNERAASAYGLPATRTKILTFVLSGCLAGLAGSLYITVLGGVGLGTFQPTMSVNVFCYAVIGGIESVGGAIAGVVLFRALDYVISETAQGTTAAVLRLSLSGTGLLVILYFLPGGLWQLAQRLRDRLVARFVPEPPAPEEEGEVIDDADAQDLILSAADDLEAVEPDGADRVGVAP